MNISKHYREKEYQDNTYLLNLMAHGARGSELLQLLHLQWRSRIQRNKGMCRLINFHQLLRFLMY